MQLRKDLPEIAPLAMCLGMKLEADSRLSFPRELVFSTYRDRLPQLVPYLPNVKAITVQKREDEANGISRLLNLWEAKGEIPTVARKWLSPDMLKWFDHALWNQGDWTVEWRVETTKYAEHIKCRGKNRYVALPDGGTMLELRGDLSVDVAGIGVPRLLAGTAGPIVEKFVIALLTPNLVSVAKGLEQFLQAEAKNKAP